MLKGSELGEQFLVECPPRLISAIVKTIKNAYKASELSVKQHLREEVQPQAWGYDRWLTIESELLYMAERMGITSHWRDNTENTHIGHVELHFEHFFLTAVRTNTKDSKPNYAQYRKNFAESNQGMLFELDPQPKDKKIWVAIQHVPNVKQGIPEFIRAVFYDNEYKHSCEAVDLMAIAHKYDRDQQAVELKPKVKIALKDQMS